MRPPSPSHSASGSINGFTFEATASSTSISTSTRSRPNFWDFEAYSRAFLHEKKAIEREKEEWEKRVEERRVILKKSMDFYLEKYEKLKQRSASCLENSQKLSDTTGIEQEISDMSLRVDQLKKLIKYFEQAGKLMKEIEGEKEEEFKNELLKQNWKFGLEKLLKLIGSETDTFDGKQLYLERMKWEIINERTSLFHEEIVKKIQKYVEGLGWPKIISNEETAEIISRLQELLTYGEAIYLLASSNTGTGPDKCSVMVSIPHPMKYFIDPIKLRFNYHFNSDRPTNQLDKPEWYFDNLIATCRETLSFLREFIFPCWRLRDLNGFLKDCIIELAKEKTKTSLETASQDLKIHYLIEFGKFLNILRDEFGYVEIEGTIEEVFIPADPEDFVERELERIKREYSALFPSEGSEIDEWTPNGPQIGEPSPLALKFLSFFHSSTIIPYSFIKGSLKLRSLLLYRVQSWALESFHDKCQFECAPIHTSKESILKDMGMINSFIVICKVLGDDFGESIDYLELSACVELHELIGYDPSGLPGTCFNKAIDAFKSMSDRLSSYVFNYAMERFLKPAGAYSNAMIYARVESDDSSSIPEDLRLAITNLLDTYNFIRRFLCEGQFTKLFKRTLPEKISIFMFQGVLLKNFFSESGAKRFEQDLQYVQESLCHMDGIDPGYIKATFSKVSEAIDLLQIKERDPTGPFDGARLSRAMRENRSEELKRFLEMKRYVNLKVEELPQVFASRRQ